jgi:predicted NUDIX family NTP pyrophosphohydrolase
MPRVSRQSAGILLYRRREGRLQVLLAHPGGPFWAKKDLGAWSIPKGEHDQDEEPEQAARREFAEETGSRIESDSLVPLGEVKQKSGKLVRAFAVEGDFDPKELHSNTFELEWPPRSGRRLEVPEVDRAEWFDLDEAAGRIFEAQKPFLERLRESVDPHRSSEGSPAIDPGPNRAKPRAHRKPQGGQP